MEIRELTIPGAWEISPVQRTDDRGVFLEWYRYDKLREAVGHPLDLRQANTSVSMRGVVRADFYWGTGPDAGAQAGRMRQQGKLWLLCG